MIGTPGISVTATDDHTIVSVCDSELFDYLEDFFVARGFECMYVSLAQPGQGQVSSFYFDTSYTQAVLSQAISDVPSSEVERILSINFKQG